MGGAEGGYLQELEQEPWVGGRRGSHRSPAVRGNRTATELKDDGRRLEEVQLRPGAEPRGSERNAEDLRSFEKF